MTIPAIEFQGVSRRYPFFSLEDVSFRLEEGQIMGFVGPNGAGKSTTMRILTGLIRQDSGRVEVFGRSMPDEAVAAKWDMGFVSEDMRLLGGETVAWHMRFARSIYPSWDDRYANALLKRFHLSAEQKIKGLSHGEHVKALLLLVLARRPRLLVLDEPTAGLDPVARHEVIAELMEVMQDEHRSILFSSHNTLEVEQICDQITFIDRGRIVESNDTESFVERWRRINLDVPESVELPSVPSVVDVVRSGHVAVVTTNAYHADMLASYAAAGASVRDVQVMTLEEIFVAIVMWKRKECGE